VRKADFGIIGLGVMGQNLALNVESKGFKVAVFNRTPTKTESFIEEKAKNKNIIPSYTLEKFVSHLESPRRILLMVKAGKAVDDFIEALSPYLEEGDLIIDGGNSHFSDTERRFKTLEEKGLLYLGAGISGGEYGALHGPSIMVGGSEKGYQLVKEILCRVSAQVEGKPCCAYLGKGGAGHFVKMTHNGIEYSIMQSLAEAYDLMKNALHMSYEEITQEVKKWNEGNLNSYLVEITGNILKTLDEETGKPILEVILDKAEQKGTGKWVSQASLDMGVPVPSFTWSVEARSLSGWKELREKISSNLSFSPTTLSKEKILPHLEKALYLSMIISFTQGLHLLYRAKEEMGYEIPLREVCQIWKGGCIIRCGLLYTLEEVFKEEPQLPHLFISPKIQNEITKCVESLKKVVNNAHRANIPVPVLTASLDYLLSFTRSRLPANLIQAQRDYFGAHTYQRVDKEGYFHTEWFHTPE